MHDKKHKGDIGLTQIIAELVKQEFNVSVPISEHLKYDLIIEKEGLVGRVQIKYTTANDNGRMAVKIQSVWSNSKGKHRCSRKKGDYDLLAVYCPTVNKCYFIADKDFDAATELTLILTDAKSKNGKKQRFAKDYEQCDVAFGKLGE